MRRQREAISVAKEIIEVNTEIHRVSHVSVGRSQFQRAQLYWAQGQYREADTPYRLALWIFEQRLPPVSLETEQVVVRLVNSYSEQKLWQEVNILLLYWFDVTKQTLGPDARQTVQAIESAMGDASGMKRIGQPIEVGRVAAFLASDEASYMTGNAVEVTGGLISAGIN